jgi:hypothetical protein
MSKVKYTVDKQSGYPYTALVVTAEYEYYCRGCNQLRLWAREGKPSACTNCGSSDIDVDKRGSERLFALRHP